MYPYTKEITFPAEREYSFLSKEEVLALLEEMFSSLKHPKSSEIAKREILTLLERCPSPILAMERLRKWDRHLWRREETYWGRGAPEGWNPEDYVLAPIGWTAS